MAQIEPTTVLDCRSMISILFAHNRYQQRGGEDAVICSDEELTATTRHEIVIFVKAVK